MARHAIAAASLVAALAQPVRAQPATDGNDPDSEAPHYVVILGWTTLVMAIPAAYYWNTQSLQKVDWTLSWDWPSWKAKLFGTSLLKFDTNSFTGNTIRHPLTGWANYQIARSNGIGPLGSELFAIATGMVWEYVAEYPEDPSINDLIMNPIGGIAVGEPLYQLGQIWRGGQVSIGDRVRTAVFSPFDATQDLWRRQPRWWRPRVWRDLMLAVGGNLRRVEDGAVRHELVLRADFDLVNHRDYLLPGARSSSTGVGAWSRVAVRFGLGDPGDDKHVSTVMFHSQASIAGHYAQGDGGERLFVGIGSAFTYRRERLAAEWDRIGLAHVLGPQLQLVSRSAARALRWDLAAYGDFAMMQAHVLGPVSILPRPPPYYSAPQVAGYYDGLGASVFTRLRLDSPPWHGDVEMSAYQVWQIDCCDRTPTVAAHATSPSLVPHGIADTRIYWRATLGYRPGAWGVAVELGGAYRRGAWGELVRSTTERELGLTAQIDL